MAYANQMNQPKDISVNTRGIQFFNTQESNYTLRVDMWNQNICLYMYPKLQNPTQENVYNYATDARIHLVITPIFARMIGEITKREGVPAVIEGKEWTKSFIIGDHVLVLSSGVKKYGGIKPYAVIVRNAVKPENMISAQYLFNHTFVVDNYDGEQPLNNMDPQLLKGNAYQFEFMYFADILSHMAIVFDGAEYHIGKYHERYWNKNVLELYRALGNNVGYQFYAKTGNGFGNRSAANSYIAGIFGSPIQATQPSQPPQMTAAQTRVFDSSDELNDFIQ